MALGLVKLYGYTLASDMWSEGALSGGEAGKAQGVECDSAQCNGRLICSHSQGGAPAKLSSSTVCDCGLGAWRYCACLLERRGISKLLHEASFELGSTQGAEQAVCPRIS